MKDFSDEKELLEKYPIPKFEGFDYYQDINICIVGSSGHGKSTFINSIRNLNEENIDEKKENLQKELGTLPSNCYDLAQTSDLGECTMDPTKYKFHDPIFDQMSIWDIYGCDTKKFPAKT